MEFNGPKLGLSEAEHKAITLSYVIYSIYCMFMFYNFPRLIYLISNVQLYATWEMQFDVDIEFDSITGHSSMGQTN